MTMALTASKLIEIALAEVGYLEKETNSQLDNKTANAGDENWTKYARDLYAAGYYNGNKNGYAWCDVFVDWLFLQLCGKDAKKAEEIICQTGDYGAGCTFSMRYYKNAGRFFSSPKPGDQIFFGSGSNSSHTGIVYKVDSSNVYTIEGNTSGASGVVANGGGVCKKSYSLNYSKIIGYGRPRYDEETGQTETKTETTTTTSKGETTVNIELTVLKNGSSGEQVKTLQRLLMALGFEMKSNSGKVYGVDGSFGGATENAVKAFQKSEKLSVDGIVGKNTWGKLLKG